MAFFSILLRQRAQPKRPGRNSADKKEISAGPRILLKACRNCVRANRACDEEDIRRVFQRSAEDNEAFPVKTVHEGGMSIPPGLLFQAKRGIPGVAPGADDGKELHDLIVRLRWRRLVTATGIDHAANPWPNVTLSRSQLPFELPLLRLTPE
jgi:hypothetical protein